MKKSLMLVAAAAVLSVSSSAMAIDVNQARVLEIQGFTGLNSSLGAVTFTALGRSGRSCEYLMDWASPFNPNDVAICIVRELTTPWAPSCVLNEQSDIATTVLAGPAADSLCAGFNIKGELFDGVTLILGESQLGLQGVAIFPGALGTVYPIVSGASGYAGVSGVPGVSGGGCGGC